HTLRFVCDHAATPARHTLSLHDALPILPGTTFSGSTIVTLTVTDASGNSSDTSFNVNVIDTTDPTIDAIADQTVNGDAACMGIRSEEHTSELQSRENLVCRLLLEKKKIA